MTYSQLIQRLLQVNTSQGSKLGLHNMQRLQALLHFPDRCFASIHIGGTNGKGSVTTKIASAFTCAGYRVGLYTSPHLSCFRERIRVNDVMIPEEKVAKILAFLFALIEKEQIPATFFEITTCLAFLYFAEQQVDIAAVEVGLGGRLDSTNIITPCLSIITSISLDHTDILGNTLEAIAKEKGGIIKEKVPVVIGPRVPLALIQEIANSKQSPCFQVKKISPLFEEENQSIARAALEHLSSLFRLSPDAIEKGLKQKPPCRFEVIPGDPPIILDVAHNPDGLLHLFQTIAYQEPSRSIRLLFGLSKNKDVSACLHLMASRASHFHLVEATNGRGASVEELDSQLQRLQITPKQIFRHASIAEGTEQAQREARKDKQLLVICGSFFIMRDVRQALGFNEPQDVIDLNERLNSITS